jgi:hypothetical protein
MDAAAGVGIDEADASWEEKRLAARHR